MHSQLMKKKKERGRERDNRKGFYSSTMIKDVINTEKDEDAAGDKEKRQQNEKYNSTKEKEPKRKRNELKKQRSATRT